MAAGDATHGPPAAEARFLVESFCAVTSATPAAASFFLEGHNWAFESAVLSFLDSTEVDADGPDPAPQPAPLAANDGPDSEDEDYVGGGDKDEDDEDYVGGSEDEDAALAAASAAVDERRRPAKTPKSSHQVRGASGRGTVRTLCLGGKRAAGSDGDEYSDDDDWATPLDLYTGGEKSGMVVRDRSKRTNVVDEVFKQTKRKGAKTGPARRQSSRSRSFRGPSRLLTGETVQSDAAQLPEEIVHNIYFQSNGFTVDDGPLRSFDDPEHASFLKSIKDSECPTELAPADGRSKELVKRPAPFQGGGRTVMAPSENSAPSDITSSATASSTATATTKTKPAMVATFHAQPDDIALAHHLRSCIQGEVIPWIHKANVYGDNLMALTARYEPATAANGAVAWYFIGAPTKKEGSDTRMSRVAGMGTWKEERTRPLVELSDGVHIQIGWRQSFTYLLKKRGKKGMPIGWIMLSIRLNDGEDAQGRCLSKVYPSPYKLKKKPNPLVPLLAVLEHAPLMDSAAATTTGSVSATVITASTSATAAAATTTAVATTASAAATRTTASAAAAATTTAAMAAASAVATTKAATPAAAAAAASTSPPKKWIQVQISDSPTNSTHRPKRVYQMMDPVEQEGVGNHSSKKMRMLDFKGWLMIEPVHGSENEQVS